MHTFAHSPPCEHVQMCTHSSNSGGCNMKAHGSHITCVQNPGLGPGDPEARPCVLATHAWALRKSPPEQTPHSWAFHSPGQPSQLCPVASHHPLPPCPAPILTPALEPPEPLLPGDLSPLASAPCRSLSLPLARMNPRLPPTHTCFSHFALTLHAVHTHTLRHAHCCMHTRCPSHVPIPTGPCHPRFGTGLCGRPPAVGR